MQLCPGSGMVEISVLFWSFTLLEMYMILKPKSRSLKVCVTFSILITGSYISNASPSSWSKVSGIPCPKRTKKLTFNVNACAEIHFQLNFSDLSALQTQKALFSSNSILNWVARVGNLHLEVTCGANVDDLAILHYKRIHAWSIGRLQNVKIRKPVFQSEKKKVHENFSIQLKNDHQRLIFEAKKPERALKATFTSW